MAGEQQFLPPALPEVIPRTRLLELLDGFRDRRLIIINAPAGQGKTTLLAQYLALRRHRAVWRNLTEDDGDPARFLSALARALGTLFPGHGIEALRTPMQTTLPLDQDVAMKHWFGHLWALIPEPCRIVLDDYHRLARRSPVHRIIEILLDGMPPGFSLALLSRIPPPLRLASLLAKRQVAELTTQDLALSQEETGQLAELLLRRPLTAGESDSLWKNCEGWIAGVILMTHTLHARETQGPAFPSAGSSAGPVPGRELLFDYLAEEVFKKLSPSTQSLLCRTSILESVPVSLARILSKNPRARTILAGLQRDNLLTAALDAGGALFRYHPLFREFLRERFKTSLSAPRRVGLYRTSAGYYERQGNPEEAVRLLLEAGERTPALRLIEKNGLRLLRQGRKQTLLEWIQALPAPWRSTRPRLLFFRGLASMVEDTRGAKKLLFRALNGFRRAGDRASQVFCVGTLIEVQTLLLAEFTEMPSLNRIADRLLAQMGRSKSTSDLRAFLLSRLGWSSILTPSRDFARSLSLLEESLKLSGQADRFVEQVRTLTYLTLVSCYAEQMDRARKYADRALALFDQTAIKSEWEPMSWIAKGVVSMFAGRFDEGLVAADRAEKLTGSLGTIAFHSYNVILKGWLLLETGRPEEAQHVLEKFRSLPGQFDYVKFLCAMLLTKLHLMSGTLAAARIEASLALRLGRSIGVDVSNYYAWCLAWAGMIDIDGRRFRSARQRLERGIESARDMKTPVLEASLLLVLALGCFAQGEEGQARTALEQGLRTIAEQNASFYPIWYPSFISRVCGEALRHGIHPDYAATLLTTYARQEALPVLTGLVSDPDPDVQVRALSALAGLGTAESVKMLKDAAQSENTVVRQAARGALLHLQQDTLSRLRIHTLGPFRVLRGDEPVPDRVWQGKRMKTLLKLLVALGGSKVSQEAMMDTLWPGSAPGASAVNLRSLLSRLRQTLEPGRETGLASVYLNSKEGLLSLAQDRCWVDVKEFRQRVEEGKRMERDERPAEALAAYHKAEGLYQGDFLEEDRNEDWVLPFREQLISEHLDLLHRIARLSEGRAAREEVPSWYWKILTRNPLDEEASRGLMRSLHRLGRSAEALRAYQECRERLIAELGVEPTEETTALYREIRESMGQAS